MSVGSPADIEHTCLSGEICRGIGRHLSMLQINDWTKDYFYVIKIRFAILCTQTSNMNSVTLSLIGR